MIPEYTIRESSRAKHVRFRVTVSEGLVVVIPAGFDRARIPELLEEKRAWLAKAVHQIEQHRQAMPDPNQRPTTIELPSLDQSWRLEWLQTDEPMTSLVRQHPFELLISGAIDDTHAWKFILRQWLIAQARESLIPWTQDLSEELGIPIQRVTVRCQKTRWGSYSSKGTVSLNAQLLLLPRPLVSYVLIHEICHAVHPDHSPRFWQLVRQWEPDAIRLRSELRKAGRFVPSWLQSGAREQGRSVSHDE